MHLHNALSTSDAIVLTKDDLGSGEGEDHYCREHLHLDWTDLGGKVNSYMEQVTSMFSRTQHAYQGKIEYTQTGCEQLSHWSMNTFVIESTHVKISLTTHDVTEHLNSILI